MCYEKQFTGTVNTGGVVSDTKLPALIITLESKILSPASAIASLMWFVAKGVTTACDVNVTVKPSKSLSPGKPLLVLKFLFL